MKQLCLLIHIMGQLSLRPSGIIHNIIIYAVEEDSEVREDCVLTMKIGWSILKQDWFRVEAETQWLSNNDQVRHRHVNTERANVPRSGTAQLRCDVN